MFFTAEYEWCKQVGDREEEGLCCQSWRQDFGWASMPSNGYYLFTKICVCFFNSLWHSLPYTVFGWSFCFWLWKVDVIWTLYIGKSTFQQWRARRMDYFSLDKHESLHEKKVCVFMQVWRSKILVTMFLLSAMAWPQQSLISCSWLQGTLEKKHKHIHVVLAWAGWVWDGKYLEISEHFSLKKERE